MPRIAVREQSDGDGRRAEVTEVIQKIVVTERLKLLKKARNLIRAFSKSKKCLSAVGILGLPQQGFDLVWPHKVRLSVADVSSKPTVATRVTTDVGHRNKDVAGERDACRKGKRAPPKGQ